MLAPNCTSFFAIALLVVRVFSEDPVVVTGIRTGILTSGQRPLRFDIKDLQATGGPLWPYIPWNDIGQGDGCPKVGFCPHGEVPFASWHRPYLALFEQALGDHVKSIASQYTGEDSDQYTKAAQVFRIPYWDWATDAKLPPATTSPNITVNGPEGKMEVRNPLYSFYWPTYPLNDNPDWFPGAGAGGDANIWNHTNTQRLINGDNSASDLQLNVDELRDKVYATFTKSSTFETMASSQTHGSSFEDPHNMIHNSAGVTMQPPEYSAFDPIFWLHHCNVDRLLALWQAKYYKNTYQTEPSNSTSGTYTVRRGSLVNGENPLMPFYLDNRRNFHTGVTMASTKGFGYTYPGIDDWSMSAEETSQNVTALVKRLYGSDGASLLKRSGPQRMGRASWKEYYVQIGVERAELECPCTISVLLGDKVAGSMALLSMPTMGRAYSEVPLTRPISQLTSCLEEKTVIPFLQQRFRVEIRKCAPTPSCKASSLEPDLRVTIADIIVAQDDNTQIPVELVPSLTIDMYSEDVEDSGPDNFPTHGIPQFWPNIGRPARKL
ncbi:hypothetical protein JX266_007822 [Neoarthrinium moseri]|nr:hypothetical protein JX266_007822 [Neoarthrinium moseri]